MRSGRARLALVIVVLMCVTFIVLGLRGGGDSVRGAGATTLGPFQRVVSSITQPIGNFFSSLTRIRSNEKTISALQARNSELETQLRVNEGQAGAARQLQKLLKTAGQGRIRIVPARVIAIGPSQGFAWSATLDSGSRDGIKKDQTVINGDGLVGRVTSVGATTSTVLLAIDPNSSIGARAAKSSEVGIATGNGLSGLTFQLLNQSATLQKGDPLLTFGSRRDRPFIPGIPMGIITEVKGAAGSLTRTAVVKTYVNFSALDVVGVVVAVPARDPRDSLIPRSPTPAPTVTITLTPSSTAKPTPTPSVTRARTPRPTPTGT